VSTLGAVALVTWLVGGLPVGVAYAIWAIRGGADAIPPGLNAFVGWVLAPLILAGVIIAGVCRLLGHVVGEVERVHRLWPRPTREALEQQIRELEDETGMGP
jgi:hypothetical protein